jgi:hypothetical protein
MREWTCIVIAYAYCITHRIVYIALFTQFSTKKKSLFHAQKCVGTFKEVMADRHAISCQFAMGEHAQRLAFVVLLGTVFTLACRRPGGAGSHLFVRVEQQTRNKGR